MNKILFSFAISVTLLVSFQLVRAEDEPQALEKGKPIDLLKMVKLPDHIIMGKWKRLDGALVCEALPYSRIMAPVSITGGYQISIKYTRRTSNDRISLIIPVGDTQCRLVVDDSGGKYAGLDVVNGLTISKLTKTPAAITQSGPTKNGVQHTMDIMVIPKGNRVSIRLTFDGKMVVDWRGTISQLSLTASHTLPHPKAVGVLVYNSVADIHELTLTLSRSGRGYQLGDDWKSPLIEVLDKPTKDVARQCADFNGKKYFISSKPLSFPDAQRLALKLKGRLLTISSSEEEQFILQQGRGINLWMAGWRPPSKSFNFRDERNRPLKYIGKWESGQPNTHRELQWNLEINTSTPPKGWNDVHCREGRGHACIEWGEEYPSETKTP